MIPDLDEEELVKEVLAQLAREERQASRCFWCRRRCDPPFGNGELCLTCWSRPDAETMHMILR